MSSTIRSLLGRIRCAVAKKAEVLERAKLSRGRRMVGWVTAESLAPARRPECLACLTGAVGMRVGNNARWLNRNTDAFWNEAYRKDRRYDVVVFFKAMDEACQAEAARLRAQGTRIIFDANVNYYEVWGDYDIKETRPTPTQQRDAVAMTRNADHVVADSSYIAEIARRYNPHVTWIPDNLDLALFRRRSPHTRTRPERKDRHSRMRCCVRTRSSDQPRS